MNALICHDSMIQCDFDELAITEEERIRSDTDRFVGFKMSPAPARAPRVSNARFNHYVSMLEDAWV